MSNKVIFRTLFGSHLYGTDTPSSDKDYKSIFLPSKRDLVLQRASKNIDQNTKTDSQQKNTAEDIDDESFSLQEYFKLLCEGQTVALDMLFSTRNCIIQSGHTFTLIKANKDKFLHKGLSAFVGYTKAQAAKYGVKGFRVRALKDTIEWISKFPKESWLFEIGLDVIKKHVAETPHTAVVYMKGSTGIEEPMLEICSRKFPLHNKVGYMLNALQMIYSNYGQRALLAEKNEGIDWKALSHAVRVAKEAEELLLTGNITFPCPEKELLLKIKKGEMPYSEVSTIIEEGLVKVQEAQTKSTLRETPDRNWIDDFIYNIHLEIING